MACLIWWMSFLGWLVGVFPIKPPFTQHGLYSFKWFSLTSLYTTLLTVFVVVVLRDVYAQSAFMRLRDVPLSLKIWTLGIYLACTIEFVLVQTNTTICANAIATVINNIFFLERQLESLGSNKKLMKKHIKFYLLWLVIVAVLQIYVSQLYGRKVYSYSVLCPEASDTIEKIPPAIFLTFILMLHCFLSICKCSVPVFFVIIGARLLQIYVDYGELIRIALTSSPGDLNFRMQFTKLVEIFEMIQSSWDAFNEIIGLSVLVAILLEVFLMSSFIISFKLGLSDAALFVTITAAFTVLVVLNFGHFLQSEANFSRERAQKAMILRISFHPDETVWQII
ncbi:unnamed protein product [Allacma fusca]|uniref:Gustatory receptor n=1 Tax=Allacma fusca TaxID=39272 RepID=A0A8J2P1B4_9HEXA|nr:unnamed protein product [Allacma fusca]